MTYKIGDYAGLLYEINVATARDFTGAQSEKLINEFKKIDWKEAYKITTNYTRMSRFPQNIYGNLLEIIENKYYETTKKEENNPNFIHPISKDCISPQEFNAISKTISLLSKFKNSSELLNRFGVMLQQISEEPNITEKVEKVYQIYLKKSEDPSNLRKTLILE